MAAAVSGGAFEGPGEDPAPAMGSGCPPGSVVEEVGIMVSSLAKGSASAILAVTTTSSAPEVDFSAASREAGILKSGALVACCLAVVFSDESKLALVGLLLAEATVFLMKVALMPENIQTRLSTLVSTMPRIGDLIGSSVDKAEAFVSPVETLVSPADAYGNSQSLAMVSVHPVGDGAVPGKEGEPIKIASAKGGFFAGKMVLRL
jgi:hypothetical protein